MKTVSSLRDLVRSNSERGPSQQEYMRMDEFGRSVRDAAFNGTPIEPARTRGEEKVGVALPGDPCEVPDNPFIAMNPQRAAAMLRRGGLDPETEARARQSIEVYQGFTGERVMWTEAPEPDVDRPPSTYSGPGCVVPDPNAPKISTRSPGGRTRRKTGEAPYQGAAEPMLEHELSFLWR